jgi:hypothetical protein
MYQRLVNHQKVHHHCNVVQKNNQPLYDWVKKQKKKLGPVDKDGDTAETKRRCACLSRLRTFRWEGLRKKKTSQQKKRSAPAVESKDVLHDVDDEGDNSKPPPGKRQLV